MLVIDNGCDRVFQDEEANDEHDEAGDEGSDRFDFPVAVGMVIICWPARDFQANQDGDIAHDVCDIIKTIRSQTFRVRGVGNDKFKNRKNEVGPDTDEGATFS